jgi:hypothetical protein
MELLPTAPLYAWVGSPSQSDASLLYGAVDAAVAKSPGSIYVLSDGVVAVRALTERDFESAVALARTQVPDLHTGPLKVVYLDKAFPQEPFYRVAVTTPPDYIGDVIGDLNARKGCIESMHNDGESASIKCGAPIATMLGYNLSLSKITNGRGHVEYAFIGYHQRIVYPQPPHPPAVAARA